MSTQFEYKGRKVSRKELEDLRDRAESALDEHYSESLAKELDEICQLIDEEEAAQ
jgi:hypothetical protein